MPKNPCNLHPSESAGTCLSCHLMLPCDDCDRTATHNAYSKNTGKSGRYCNSHMDWDKPAFARND